MTVTVVAVPWDDPRGVVLRAAVDAEIGPRHADRVAAATPEEREARTRAFRIDPATVVGVHLALDEDGSPIGLRRSAASTSATACPGN